MSNRIILLTGTGTRRPGRILIMSTGAATTALTCGFSFPSFIRLVRMQVAMDTAWPSVRATPRRVARLTCTFVALGLALAAFMTVDTLHPQLEANAQIWP